MVNDVSIGWLKVTTSVTLAGAGEKTWPSIDELTMYGRHVGREERVAIRRERLAAHIRDLVAVGIGPDRHDVRQVDARRVGARRNGPVDGVRVDKVTAVAATPLTSSSPGRQRRAAEPGH